MSTWSEPDWLIGGVEPFMAVIVEHDPGWAVRFEQLAEEIRQALGPVLLDVQHVGSTAVPGLAAKPVIDIACTVVDASQEEVFVPALVSLGYVLRARLPGRRFLRTPAKDVHVHVLTAGHQQLEDYLLLRAQLTRSPADRELYARTKRELARREWADMTEYSAAKSEVLSLILARARLG